MSSRRPTGGDPIHRLPPARRRVCASGSSSGTGWPVSRSAVVGGLARRITHRQGPDLETARLLTSACPRSPAATPWARPNPLAAGFGLQPCQPRPWQAGLTEQDGREHHIPDLVGQDFTAETPGQKLVG
ncbi:MAG: hypothetical protein ACRDTA_09855, partial [Pseudonocardiaceae bacterium]